jgi:HAE1 family hydrophobic/amphiphilic exporter-1
MKISDVSIRQPVFSAMMIAALLVLGWFSYTGLAVELFPQVEFPFVVVSTVYPGAAAEAVESEVTEKIEEAVNQISGIRHIASSATEGYTFTFVEFELETDGAEATQDVREKVAGIRGDLPEDIEAPIISQYDMDAQAIMSVAIAGSRPQREITQLVKDKIKTRLEAVRGVGAVHLVGGHEREIQVLLDPDRLESYELSVDDVRWALMDANLEIPGGRIDESSREYSVRVLGKLKQVDQFESIVVVHRQGIPVHVSDVARVVDTVAEVRSASTYNGRPSISLDLIKQSGANIVDLARQARQVLEELKAELPPDIEIVIVNDNSVFIEESISEILFNIRFGTVLAVLVIFLFLLDVRPTLITGLSIPISIIATFTAMKFLGFTINFMTLLGLSLAVGILIDDSIVVVENIYRHIQEGKTPIQAAFTGTKEIGLAVMATTFAIVAVFLPVAFMEGIIGRFFYQFGMTVSVAVMISLFVAFTLVPMLASQPRLTLNRDILGFPGLPNMFGAGFVRGFGRVLVWPFKLTLWLLILPLLLVGWILGYVWKHIKGPLNLWNRVFDRLKPFYRAMLAYSLRTRWLVVVVATFAFFSAIWAGTGLGQEWMSEFDQSQVFVMIETAPGTTLEETTERFAEVEKIVTQLNEAKGTYVTIGSGNSGVTEGMLLIQLTDLDKRELSAEQLVDSVRGLVAAVPGIKYSVASQPSEGGSAKPIELSIRGENRDELIRLAHVVQEKFRTTLGITDIDNSLEEGKPELQITVDRKAAHDLGINIASLSTTIRNLIEGDVVSRFKEGDEEYDVRVQLQEKYRSSEDDVGRMLIASTKDVVGMETFLVPLNRVAKVEKQTSIGEYARFDRQPEVRVNANPLAGYFSGTISQELLLDIDSTVQLPPGYSIAPVGEEQIREESNVSMASALVLAVVFIYLLLASQYGSFFDPFSIMLSLPLSLIGAVLALRLFGDSLNIMTQIGIILLMGLVTKNAILLIDFVKQRRRDGLDREAAILEAGPIRLRPILMTAMATVLGVLPLALGIGEGAEMRAPMARAVIGGMTSSTLLTLIVVPVVYTIIDDVIVFCSRLFRKETAEAEKDLVLGK